MDKARAWLSGTLILVSVLLLLYGFGILRAGSPMDGPVPPPTLQCATFEDNGTFLHLPFAHPLPQNAPEAAIREAMRQAVRAEQLKTLGTGDSQRLARLARIAGAVETASASSWTAGGLCGVYYGWGNWVLTGCSSSCTGPGCIKVKVNN